MTIFLRLLSERDKAGTLLDVCSALRSGIHTPNVFSVEPTAFLAIPSAPFSYWVSKNIRWCFKAFPLLESSKYFALGGLKTLSDERFLRCYWEVKVTNKNWISIAKGGEHSPFYSDLPLVVNWGKNGADISWYGYQRRPREGFGASSRGVEAYFLPGITWGRRTQAFGPKILPSGCLFSDKGPAVFSRHGDKEGLMSLLALMLSSSFFLLISTRLNAADTTARSFEVGTIQGTPVPELTVEQRNSLAALARSAWSIRRRDDTMKETSHAFLMPAALRPLTLRDDAKSDETGLKDIQAEIDEIAFNLFGFSDADRAAALGSSGSTEEYAIDASGDCDDEDAVEAVDQTDGLLSWASGVAFGRFDWRLATGEREAPPEPDPFDPLPAKSPGMLPDGAEPFLAHSGILVDDQGHPNDLARLIEEVLARVDAPVPADVRRWLQRDFFPLHLRQYSKSRRKAPIYWPISTNSGSYTLWLYYPSLTDQTLFTAVNDLIQPKLKQVDQDVAALRTKGSARSRDDEKNFEALQTLELELIELRDTLLAIAQTYRPNHDDGVQITAAPLWQLFRHKPWQKILKDTWAKLEKGDYDWAHLAMAYWPERVREKCETDKSLAIAHDLEHLYVEPGPKPTKARGRKKNG